MGRRFFLSGHVSLTPTSLRAPPHYNAGNRPEPPCGAPIVTVSIGAGTIVPSHNDNDTPLAFIREVDRRLYRAKEAGRNVTIARAG